MLFLSALTAASAASLLVFTAVSLASPSPDVISTLAGVGVSGLPAIPGVEVVDDISPSADPYSLANVDGSALLTNLDSGGPNATDQVGDVYTTSDNEILRSVSGAAPAVFLTDVCGGPGVSSLVSMAFTPDGQQGAWVCQDYYAAYVDGSVWNGVGQQYYSNASIVYWNGTSTKTIYTGQGAFAGTGTNTAVEMAISPDGSKLIYEASDETVAGFTSRVQAASGAMVGSLYMIPTATTTPTGEATVLDSTSADHAIASFDGYGGNNLAFTDNGNDVVYDVGPSDMSAGTSNTIYQVSVDAASGPAPLVADNGVSSWQVIGSSDSNGNGFACQEITDNPNYWNPSDVVVAGVCDSAGDLSETMTVPTSDPGYSYSSYVIDGYSSGDDNCADNVLTALSAPFTSNTGINRVGTCFGDGGPASAAELYAPFSVAADTSNNVLFVDLGHDVIREVAGVSGVQYGQNMVAGDIYDVAGDYTGAYSTVSGAPATSTSLDTPNGVAVDASGDIFIDTGDGGQVFEVDNQPGVSNQFGQNMSDGDIYVIAGNNSSPTYGCGSDAFSGEFATADNLGYVESVATDAAGNVFVVGCGDVVEIAAVSGSQYGQNMTSGYAYALAGGGSDFTGANGVPAGTAVGDAALNDPIGIAVDGSGDIFYDESGSSGPDSWNDVREIANTTSIQFGIAMTAGDTYTIAGGDVGGYSGDNGPGPDAELNGPWFLSTDVAGNVYVADLENHRIREIDGVSGTASQFGQIMTDGDIYTLAGDGVGGYAGDNGTGVDAELYYPEQAALGAANNLFIADNYNDRIREISQPSAPTDITVPAAPSGTAASGSILNADNGTWTNSPSVYTYQWQDCTSVEGNVGLSCSDIVGATSAAYTLQNSDIGDYIVVEVSAGNGDGAALPVASAPTAAVAPAGATVVTKPTTPITTNLLDGSLTSSQWSLLNTGQTLADALDHNTTTGTPGDDINAEGAWKISRGAGVVIAVVDTGVDVSASDLGGQTVPGYNFVDGNTSPIDGNGHGTFVSSEIVADGTGIRGIAPDAKVMPLQVLDSGGTGTSDAIATAFDYAGSHGLRIVSASLGGGEFTQATSNAITSHPNTLYVLAAGNDGDNNDLFPFYPCSIPAANVICVGASDQNDKPASFSNYGVETVALFAPGVNILGDWIDSNTGCIATPICPIYNEADGTSMATPLVAGTLALELAANPKLSAAQLKYALLSSVDKIPALAGKASSGGRLDAAAAVLAAEHPQATPPPSVSILSGPDPVSQVTSANVSYSITGNVSTVKCTLSLAPASAKPLPCGPASALLNNMKGGTYFFTVTATGDGGSSSAYETWTVSNPTDINALLLQCPARPITIENIYVSGNNVVLDGTAEASDDGHIVKIYANHKLVAHTLTVPPGSSYQGGFKVVLPLPPAAARKDTSYVAAVGKQVSPAVSLKQRISITGITSYTNNSWQISGEVRPYTNKQILVLQQRVGCGQWEIAWSAFWGTAATGNKNSGYFYATGQHLNGGAVYRVVILPAPNPYYYNGKESVIAASLQVAV